MTQKHTPGPWYARLTKGDNYQISDNVFGKHTSETIAPTVRGQANAALIAAAPDLLEALKYVRSVARDAGLGAYGLNTDLIDAAIAKAEGR